MKRSIAAGFVLGFVPFLLAVALWFVVPTNGVTSTLVELIVPATVVAGLIAIALPDYRRVGLGIVLGSLTLAVGSFSFVMWAFSHWGS